jgi:hypothetical protein
MQRWSSGLWINEGCTLWFKGGITNLVKDIGSDKKNNLEVLSRILSRKEHNLRGLESGELSLKLC